MDFKTFSSKKRVLLITTSFPDIESKGSEAAGSFAADLAETLAEHLNVTVLAPAGNRGDELHGNLRVHRFPVPCLPLSELRPYNPVHWPSMIRTLRTGQDELNSLAAEGKFDHIVAMWALPSGYWARKAWKRYGIPYSTWALGSDIWSLRRVPVVKGLLAKVLRDSHTCLADGYQLKKDVEAISGRSCEFLASSRKLPIVARERKSTVPPYRLAFLGRWHPNKGVDLMLDSLNLLSDQDWQKIEEVRICGGGPLEGDMKSGCNSLKKVGRPVFVGGYLGRKEAAELLAWADYLLIPSRIESIPVIFSDAMQAGCPVIATPVGDLPTLMRDSEVGILAGDVTAGAFASAMRSALAVPPERFSHGLKEACKMFDIHQTASRLLDLVLTPGNQGLHKPS